MICEIMMGFLSGIEIDACDMTNDEWRQRPEKSKHLLHIINVCADGCKRESLSLHAVAVRILQNVHPQWVINIMI